MTILDGRVLTAASINELYFQQRIFVVTANRFNLDKTIRLGVFIPGETETARANLRDELCNHLLKTLTGVDNNWVIDVELKQDPATSELVIAVDIDDARLMADESEDEILRAVRVFMAVRAKRMHRQLTVLSANQLLVPLNFEYSGAPNDFMTLRLPRELKLTNSFGRVVDCSDTEGFYEAYSLLNETLVAMLQAKGFRWKLLSLVNREGVRLDVIFDSLNPLKPYQLNMFEAVIAQVLSAHARYSNSIYSELTFQPTSRHYAEHNDY